MTTTEIAPAAATPVGDDSWRLNVLGPVELCYDGRPVEVYGLTRVLLGLLTRTPCEETPTATLIAGMWGSDAPEDAEKELASHVSRLRKALTVVAPHVDPTSVVVTRSAGYVLSVAPSNADVLAFERLTADGRRALTVGQPELALSRLDDALSLWRGPAYADFGDHPFVRAEAIRLEELRACAIESKMEAELALAAPGVPTGLIDELESLVAEHWHRERLWAQLMIAYARLGRRSDALGAFQRAAEHLANSLQAQPGEELRRLERAIQEGSTRVLGAPAVSVTPTMVPPALTTTSPECFGREQEIAWLLNAIDLAATRRAQARLIVGTSGMGKSRLAAEVAQRAARRGVIVRHWVAAADGIEVLVAEPDRVSLVIVEDLDQASPEDAQKVAGFIRSAMSRPVVTLVTCREPARLGDLSTLPKLVLGPLDDGAIADIVRIYAPGVAPATAVKAMISAGGVPGRVHRHASEWAFARAGRRIDRAAADAPDRRQWLSTVRDEVVGGVMELAHVRSTARALLHPGASTTAPYPGLRPFHTEDAELFFGREELVAELVARLVHAPLLAVVGAVGSGVSSLVRAGLLPALAADVLPHSGQWRPLVVNPTGVADLAAAVAEVAAAPAPAPGGPADGAAPVDGGGLAEGQEPPATGLAGPAPVVLVIDHLEEVFTLLDAPARHAFLDAVVEVAATNPVVLTIRSDFYSRLTEHSAVSELVTNNTVLVGPMAPDQLRRAIEAPAQLAGVTLGRDLVDTIVTGAGLDPGNLAAVALTLRRVWDGRTGEVPTLADYDGVRGAVGRFAETAFARLPSTEAREAARAMLLRLCTDSATAARVTVPDLIGTGGRLSTRVLETLVSHGVVRVVDGWAQLAHEALISDWPRLRGWLEDEAAERSVRRHLAESARAWAEGGRSPQDLYTGARLLGAVDWVDGQEISTVEEDFLEAGQRAVLAQEIRRRQRTRVLWKWLAASLAVAVLATAVACFSVARQMALTAQVARADAARAAAAALAQPDERLALLLAVAASQLDGDQSATIADLLARTPALLAATGTGVTAAAVSPDGHTIATGSTDGTISILAAPTSVGGGLSALRTLRTPGHAPINGLAFTPDGTRLVSWAGTSTDGVAASGQDASIVVWDLRTGAVDGAPFGQAWPGSGGGLAADGTTLVLAQHTGAGASAATTVAWSIDSRTPSTTYTLPTGAVDTLVVSADGRVVAFGTATGTKVLDLTTGLITAVPGLGTPLALSPDGSTLLGTNGSEILLWTPGLTAPVHASWSHGPVVAGAVAGSAFAVAGSDGAIGVWDTATLQPTETLVNGGAVARALSFAPDASVLYSIMDGGSLLAWDRTGTHGVGLSVAGVDPAALARLACTVAGRDLTLQEWSQTVGDRPYRPVCGD